MGLSVTRANRYIYNIIPPEVIIFSTFCSLRSCKSIKQSKCIYALHACTKASADFRKFSPYTGGPRRLLRYIYIYVLLHVFMCACVYPYSPICHKCIRGVLVMTNFRIIQHESFELLSVCRTQVEHGSKYMLPLLCTKHCTY